MFIYKAGLFFIISIYLVPVRTQEIDTNSNAIDIDLTPAEDLKADLYLMIDKLSKVAQSIFHHKIAADEKVKVQLFYECLCPDCRDFDTKTFKSTVEKLSNYMDIHLYPYGNARMIKKNGTIWIECQHGPEECYGNMLHACAIDYLGNITKAVLFNSCMMSPSQANKGSDDKAADVCGKLMNIDTTEIKKCASGPKGLGLLKQYGEESKKVGFKYVPYILINGQQNDGSHFLNDICAAFANPPPPCVNIKNN